MISPGAMRLWTFRRSVIVALFAGAALVAIGAYARSSTASPPPPPPANAIFIDMHAAKAARDSAGAALLSKARQRGQVRVIVGLDMALRSESALTASEFA